MMKVCFVGLGSIARRHIRNLREIYSTEEIRIDVLRHCTNAVKEDGIDNQYTDYAEMPNDYDAIFITNPTSRHINTLQEVYDKAKAFFIEKPLRCMGRMEDISDADWNALIQKADEEKVCYVACPLRYTAIVQYLKKEIDWKEVYSIRSISSSYLPDWRPGMDYRKTYSASKELGGGVASDLIHEWDYITYLIGMPRNVLKLERRLSDLEIDTEDIAIYLGEYTDKTVEVHLDYFGRMSIRKLELFTRDDTVICDFLKSTVYYTKEDKLVEFGQNRDDYQIEELKHFIKICNRETENDNSIKEAETLLHLLES